MPDVPPSESLLDSVLGRAEITQTAQLIAPYLRRTPVMDVELETVHGATTVNLKLEHLQVSASFKARGAFNRLLRHRPKKVVAASGGNHGIAVAYAAQRLGIEAHIFVPVISAAAKVARLRELGAHVHQQGEQYYEALEASQVFAQAHGALVSHAYDQPETLQGQATLAYEWQQQSAHLDTVLIAVGGGGLIGGVAAWFRNDVKVVAVETQGCASLHEALRVGAPVDVAISGLAADALGAKKVGQLMFPIAQGFVSQALLVSDDAVRLAQRQAWQSTRLALEPAGAAAWAALSSGVYQAAPKERIGILTCGANVDLASLVAQ